MTFAEELREHLKKEDPKPLDANELMDELTAAFAHLKPKTQEEMRAYHFTTTIAPRLKDFGFCERYQTMDLLNGADPRCALQRETLAKLNQTLTGCGAIVGMIGPRGTGKTTIAAQLAAERLWDDWKIALSPSRNGVPCRITSYRKAGDLVARFKAYYGDFGSTQIDYLSSLLEHFASVECLIIDELHEVPEESRHKDRFLTDLLDKRYAGRRDTILISNQKEADFWQSTSDSIKSRLVEHGGVIPCEWPSFREHPSK
jgi:DNA replication protein DnaC